MLNINLVGGDVNFCWSPLRIWTRQASKGRISLVEHLQVNNIN